MGTYSVRAVCGLMMALLLPALCIPGLLISGASSALISALLAAQALLVEAYSPAGASLFKPQPQDPNPLPPLHASPAANLTAAGGVQVALAEEHLYAGAHGEELMYPPYMVLATSGLGLAMASKVTAPPAHHWRRADHSAYYSCPPPVSCCMW